MKPDTIKSIFSESLIKVLREFGIAGLVTYVGSLVILWGFMRELNQQRQILLGVVGVLLLSLSISIAYFRLKIQRDREQALIDMVKNSSNRLAEQIGKDLTKEQVEAVAQKIRQNQRDITQAVLGIGKLPE
ncbi:hypothetical protein KKD37_01155 [Patescibacteria group bacterium]|nr:hypothetical protein [Patescibacteria group bacterium]